MKTIKVLFALLATTIFACTESDVESIQNQPVNDVSEVNPADFGNFISHKAAHDNLSALLNQREIDLANGRDVEEAYGFMFGVDKLKELVAKIDRYNETALATEAVTGVRIYNVLTEDKSRRDVMWVPVIGIEDAIDFNKNTRPETNDLDLLNFSKPCPNACDPGNGGRGDYTPNLEIGTFIEFSNAKTKLDNLMDLRSEDLANNRTIETTYAFLFGLNKFKAFLDGIDSENEKRAGDELLTAVRVYLTLKNSFINGETMLHRDLFMIPVQQDYRDFLNVHEMPENGRTMNDPTLILNDGVKCPPDCPE
ncbi:MAG: hypothetical protein NXI20_14780 [bacterium]|nr:hypothetical protein [bacterium]